jgi:TetR/AcrR family transcriptional regulator, fatty acid metabolism regulator protein
MSKIRTDARREQVTTAVLQILGKGGVTGLTIGQIAKAVGMSEGNLYRHFKDKEDVISEAAKRVVGDLKGRLDSVMDGSAPPVERLRQTFLSHIRYIEEKEGIPRLIFSEAMHTARSDLKGRAAKAIGNYADRIAGLILEGQKEGKIRTGIDPKGLACIFVGMIQESSLRWELNCRSFSLVDEGVKLWDAFQACIT